jgi:hypothetical protein
VSTTPSANMGGSMARWGRNTGRLNENVTTHHVALLVGGFTVGGVVEHPPRTPLNGGFRPISEAGVEEAWM